MQWKDEFDAPRSPSSPGRRVRASASLLTKLGIGKDKLRGVQPGSTQANELARVAAEAWRKEQEDAWAREKAKTFNDRVHKEHERLLRLLAGQAGIDPVTWERTLRRVAVNARRQISREDSVDRERLLLGDWDLRHILEVMKRCVDEQIHLLQGRATLSEEGSGSGGGSGSDGEDGRPGNVHGLISKNVSVVSRASLKLAQKQLASSIIHRLQHGKGKKEGVAGGLDAHYRALDRQDSADFDVLRRVAQEMKDKALGSRPATAAAATHGLVGRGSISGVSQVSGPYASSRRRASQDSMNPHSVRRALLTPLCQQFYDMCSQLGSHHPELLDQISISEATRELKLVGLSMTSSSVAVLHKILPACTHLTVLNITRTALPTQAAQALLPAAAALHLKTVQLVNTEISAEAWDALQRALMRPTQALVQPPPAWWSCLRELNLTGNALGDEGFLALAPALCGMQELRRLSLRQTGITDYSAARLGSLITQLSRLEGLDLAYNRLAALTGQALASALPSCPKLSRLELSWNSMPDGVHPIVWALMSPAAKSIGLRQLEVAGTDLSSNDLMSLAALLRFGAPKLSRLDIGHNELISVAGQCLMRQIDIVSKAAHAKLMSEHAYAGLEAAAAARQKRTAGSATLAAAAAALAAHGAHAGLKTHFKDAPSGGGAPAPGAGRRVPESKGALAAATVTLLASTTEKGKDAQLSGMASAWRSSTPLRPASVASHAPSHALSKHEPPEHMQIFTMGCRVALGEGSSSHAKASTFSLDLSRRVPDRLLAVLLAEHEVQARHQHHMAWLSMKLDTKQYRLEGVEVEAFDVVYEGWMSEACLPESGVLQLQVLVLPDSECHWLQNQHIQAVRQLHAQMGS